MAVQATLTPCPFLIQIMLGLWPSRQMADTASASNDYTVKLWDAQSGKVLQTLDGHSGFGNSKILSHSDYVRAVAFSPDSEMLASASDDCIVKLWDASSGEMLQEIEVDDVVYTLSFSDDGSYLSTNERLHSELLSVKAATPSISAGAVDVTSDG